MIRRATLDDLDWVMGVAKARYPDFDEAASRAWVAQNLDNPRLCPIRGEKGFALGAINAPFYAPTRLRGYMVFIASEDGAGFEPCTLLSFLVRWAWDQGAQSFHFGEDTGQNLAPLAKRVGAEMDRASFVVKRHG